MANMDSTFIYSRFSFKSRYDDPLDKLPPLTRLMYKRMRWERDIQNPCTTSRDNVQKSFLKPHPSGKL